MIVAASTASAQKAKHTFAIKGGSFLYDGKPIQIHCGEMHFARVPHQYWRQCLRMIKAMGMNAVGTYIFWNWQETEPGVWDFSGYHDLAKFVKTAAEEGLFVIIRPGPYACAEWEFGGFPWWLQKTRGLEVRTCNQPFLDSCKTYFEKISGQIRSLQITHGGPVIMVQVENELGSYVVQRRGIPLEQHKKYNAAVKQMLVDNGIDVPLYTADGIGTEYLANGQYNVDTLKKYINLFHGGKGPYMVSEFYPGEFDLSETGDTFLDMENWGKGIVFINGHNPGCYWKTGPQQTLYVPGCWLKKGKSAIRIFEQQNDTKHSTINTVKKPILDKLN